MIPVTRLAQIAVERQHERDGVLCDGGGRVCRDADNLESKPRGCR